MHVAEESDSGVVPMNYSNQDGKPSAEREEGRPLIKENARQSGTHPTQSGARVSQGLVGVRKAAREGKEIKFTALLHHLTADLLRESFYALKRKAAPGVDDVTWQEYETGLEGRLADLHSRVHRGAYRAKGSETEMGTPQGAVISPLLANIYLHYVFDLWVDVWRKKCALGDVIVVRYADDSVLGFQHRA